MPGQATVTINDNQWSVWVANTLTELSTGLSGIESIPASTGMLFVLGAKRQVTVDTSQMNFPLDIIFISESLVIDVASNIQPGYLVTEETPCDMFLEVNAGEAAGVEVGDTVTTATIQQPGINFSQIMYFAIPVALLGFVSVMVGGMARLMGGSSLSLSPGTEQKRLGSGKVRSSPGVAVMPRLPEEAKGDILFLEYIRDLVKLGETVTDEEAKLMWEAWKKQPVHHSLWLTLEQREGLQEKYGSVAVRWAEEATRPGDVKGVETAAEYYYKKIKEALGLGHLSPELTEEQIMKLRETLGLPKEVPPREKGYIE